MSWLAELRAIVPQRRLTFLESRTLAERQATMLLKRLGVKEPAVPTSLLAGLPWLSVSAVRLRPGAAAAVKWSNHRWTLLINEAEPTTRQRFSIGHELKHIIDHPYAETVSGRPRSLQSPATEHLCDYFAACLLMPRNWIKRAYASGVQDVYDLAELFDVSAQAMQFRLLQLGIAESYHRCREIDNSYLRLSRRSPLKLAA